MFTSESTLGAKLDFDVSHDENVKKVEREPKKRYNHPVLTVDGVLVVDGKLLLVRRGREPEKGKLALPGGIVEYGETTEEAIVRELKEETGISTRPVGLLGVYSDPYRDPRGHFITIAYILASEDGDLQAGDDAADAILQPIDDIPMLAFDHTDIVADYFQQNKGKGAKIGEGKKINDKQRR
jgi:8-oxo-dGTP diphosphatase